MKITWDNIDCFKITRNGKFRYNNRTWKLNEECPICKEPFFYEKQGISCSKKCQRPGEETRKRMSYSSKDEKNPSWKGGVVKNNICYYKTYYSQLEPYGVKCRDIDTFLEVQCRNESCNKWYQPTLSEVNNKIQTLNGNPNYKGEQNIYCSDNCKFTCDTYGKKTKRKSEVKVDRELQPVLRKLVFKRDKKICQICGSEKTIMHCHHIDPVVCNPIESADIDNCITLCRDCHMKVHRQKGCTIKELTNV